MSNRISPQPTDMDALNNKSGLEALQAAMGGSGFNLPFSFPPPAFLTPQHHSQNSHAQSGGSIGSGVGNQVTSSASSHSSESSQGSARNGGEPRETNNQSQGNTAGANHQQQTSWSFEEQFKQVRQASTYVYIYIYIYVCVCMYVCICRLASSLPFFLSDCVLCDRSREGK